MYLSVSKLHVVATCIVCTSKLGARHYKVLYSILNIYSVDLAEMLCSKLMLFAYLCSLPRAIGEQ